MSTLELMVRKFTQTDSSAMHEKQRRFLQVCVPLLACVHARV